MPRQPERDGDLWQRATRDVRPLAPQSPTRARVKPAPEAAPPRPTVPPPSAASATATTPFPPLDRLAGIDRANAERLKRGKHPIEARLDLHGMTQDEAHHALLGFIRSSRSGGRRCVLVITGRGSFGGGVLKAAVPRWFEEPAFRPHLLAVSRAQPRDGGAGALYVMLRRNNTATER